MLNWFFQKHFYHHTMNVLPATPKFLDNIYSIYQESDKKATRVRQWGLLFNFLTVFIWLIHE